MKKNFLVVTEANATVASGHLLECIECCHELIERGHSVTLLINSDMAAALKARIDVPVFEYDTNIQVELNLLNKILADGKYDTVLFNLRRITNDTIEAIRGSVKKIAVIDELGHRKLEPDIIFNPMVGNEYWCYDTNATTYFGHQYLVLSRELAKKVIIKREENEGIKEILISMGGVDPHNTTCKLLQWMKNYPLKINCILGGGFANPQMVHELAKECDDCRVFSNISLVEMADLMNSSDVAIAAGGNTLHELTVLGRPCLIIPSVPHEVDNGKNFEKNGSAITLSITTDISEEEFKAGLKRISDRAIRESMAKAGQAYADGLGYKRVCDILEKV